MTEKLDLKKSLGTLYAPSARQPSLIEAPRLQMLAISGAGDPNNSASWQNAAGTLFALSYTIKFAVKKAGIADYGVMPLEAFWWLADGTYSLDFTPGASRENWRWQALIVQPDLVTAAHVESARTDVARKKPEAQPESASFLPLEEGLVAQLLHLGPYADEPPNLARLHAFIAEQGYRPRGNHHEIYLSNPNRTAPAKMKTILRHAVVAAA